MRCSQFCGIALGLLCFVLFEQHLALAESGPVRIVVKTVHAKQGPVYEDPRLVDLIKQLKSLFRYSSYKLMGSNTLRLKMNQTGKIALPGGHQMRITPTGIQGNRARLQVAISKGARSVFSTNVQILNGGALTLGGPKFHGGYLLFSISSSY